MAAPLVVMMVFLFVAAPFVVMMVFLSMAARLVVMVVLLSVAAPLVIVVMGVLPFLLGQALRLHLGQLVCQRLSVLHGLHQLCAGELIPGGRHHGGDGIVLPQKRHRPIQLLLADGVRPAEDDGGSGFNLVVIEFPEVAHIDLAFSRIGHCHGVAQLHLLASDLLHSGHHIAELSHTRGFNENPVWMVLVNHLLQSLAKVSHQGAANASGIHLPNFNARLLQKAAVNSNFAEFIFDEHQLLLAVAFGNHFADESRLPGSQETRVYINLCQEKTPSI